ncbi:WD40 repeat domain-containing protein [Streptomyces sp. NBC_00433]
MAGSRNPLLVGLLAVEVVAAAGASLAGNVASGQDRWPGVLDLLRRYPWPAFGGFTVLLLVVGVVVVISEKGAGAGRDDPPPPAPPQVPGWVVDRSEADQVVSAVCRSGRRAVGITSTTGVHGAGGFGKTTLAKMVSANWRVRRRFRGRVYLITLGRGVRSPAAIAMKVVEATRFITGDAATFGDPELAGAHLGRLLDQRPPALLILDDIWFPEQLTPFLVGGQRCVRLVTTRIPEILPADAERVLVDEMSPSQAKLMLTWQLPPWPGEITEGLLRATGRLPLLLRLAHRTIAGQLDAGADPAVAAAGVLERLRSRGPAAIDPDTTVDLDDSEQRSTAVRAAIEAAAQLLPAGGYERFTELGIYAEDETVPVELVAALWQATGSLTLEQSRALCGAMGRVSLLSLDPQDGGRIHLHDVIGDYLRARLSDDRLRELNSVLVDAAAVALPVAPPHPGADRAVARAWWQMSDGYLADHLIAHLLAAGRQVQAEAVATDLRWIQWRLDQRGIAAPWTDLDAIPTTTARSAARALASTAHLLAPTTPAHARAAVLRSRLSAHASWCEQAASWRPEHPALHNRWPLPDLPDPALLRTLAGHTDSVLGVAVSRDGTWLATASADGTARIWKVTTGRTTATLTGHTDSVLGVAVSRDGTWLATAGYDSTVRVWDVAGVATAILTGHTGSVRAVAVSPDGTWLATASNDSTVRIWDVATGATRAILTGHRGWVSEVAVSPDGTWLATDDERAVRIWDAAAGATTATLTGHTGLVSAVAVSPDGTWLATAGSDDLTVRIWDVATARTTAILTGHTDWVLAVAVSPDGTWLATAAVDDTVRIWDVATGRTTAVLGHTSAVGAVAVSRDGTWLATAAADDTVRIWNVATGHPATMMRVDQPLTSLCWLPDGTGVAVTGTAGAYLFAFDSCTGHTGSGRAL